MPVVAQLSPGCRTTSSRKSGTEGREAQRDETSDPSSVLLRYRPKEVTDAEG